MRLAVLALVLAAACGPLCNVDSDCGAGEVCAQGICVEGSPSNSPDITQPTVSIAPHPTLTGAVTLTATATDDVGVTEVDYELDGAIVASAANAPWAATWTSTGTPNGPHTLTALARDAAGNLARADAQVWVVNSTGGASYSVHTALGLADHASSDPQHYLSVKPQYVISYDSATRVPNWSAWELNASYFGSTTRQDDFRTDASISLPQAQLTDYQGSGYDRGHLCPSDDRTLTVADNQATFLLTNMVPQLHTLNAGPWLKLESYARSLATAGKELYVLAGGVYAAPKTIGADAVSVPTATWKLIVVLDAPGQPVTTSTRVIAAIMPNDSTVTLTTDWKQFRVRPHDIELQTGLTLLPDLQQDVRDALIQSLDTL